jgi:hypothetical protein
MCIRALDYCPPVDITFGDYLRALITADRDVVVDDTRRYRLAFIDAFRQHGIFPRNLRSLSEESLTWDRADAIADYSHLAKLSELVKDFFGNLNLSKDRKQRWKATRAQKAALHEKLGGKFWSGSSDPVLQKESGLDFSIKRQQDAAVRFEVHSLWPVQRQRPDGSVLNQVVFSILQHRPLDQTKDSPEIWGGCTFIIDMDRGDHPSVRYLIRKPLYKQEGKDGRITQAREALNNPAMVSLAATYGLAQADEPFAMLHTEH